MRGLQWSWMFLAALMLFNEVHAQVPNAGFESWASGIPVDWSVIVGVFGENPVIEDNANQRSGSACARGTVIQLGAPLDTPLPPYLFAEFALNSRPSVLTGYYRFAPVANDGFEVVVFITNKDTVIGQGGFFSDATQSTYTQFQVPLFYATETPATNAVIEVFVWNDSTPHPGSYFLLDDLSLSGSPTAVADIQARPQSFTLSQNYPNPFNPQTTITYQLPVDAEVDLRVYNLIGQEVAALVREHQPAGERRVTFDASSLPSGTYVYRLRAGNFTQTRTMMLVR